MLYPTPIAKLIDSFSKLPGIGAKTATRLAFYTISMSDEDVNDFAKNLLEVVQFLNNQEKLPLASLLAQESAVGFSDVFSSFIHANTS